VVAGYALSPIDLIPDFIPVLGYLDDVLIVPLGILLVVKLIPPELMAEHREAAALVQDRPVNRTAALIIVAIWIASVALVGGLSYKERAPAKAPSRQTRSSYDAGRRPQLTNHSIGHRSAASPIKREQCGKREGEFLFDGITQQLPRPE
jgi:hypothetical protein